MHARLTVIALVLLAMGCAPTSVAHGQDTTGHAPVNFQQLERRDSPNDYLVCPVDVCQKAKPDRISPVFQMPARDLKNRLEALCSDFPRSAIVSAEDTHIVVEQRSLVFRFPDTIDIEIIEVGKDTSTVAVYSRSRYGYYDFGVNRRRVENWLLELAASPK